MLCVQFTFGQTIDRSVVSNAGETSVRNKIVLSFNIGEPVADLLINTDASKILSTGFIQGDQIISMPFNFNSQSISLYPNPTLGNKTTLDLKNMPDGDYILEIVNLIGQILYTKSINYTKNYSLGLELDISSFKGGVYYIRVRNATAQGKTKLVKL